MNTIINTRHVHHFHHQHHCLFMAFIFFYLWGSSPLHCNRQHDKQTLMKCLSCVKCIISLWNSRSTSPACVLAALFTIWSTDARQSLVLPSVRGSRPHQSSLSGFHQRMSVVVWMSRRPMSWQLSFPRACCLVNAPLSTFGRAEADADSLVGLLDKRLRGELQEIVCCCWFFGVFLISRVSRVGKESL